MKAADGSRFSARFRVRMGDNGEPGGTTGPSPAPSEFEMCAGMPTP